MSYQQCTRFWTTLDFDGGCLWNGSSNRQAENGVIDYDFSSFGENNLVNFGPLTKKMTLTFDLEILWVRTVVKEHVHAKFHRAKCSG